MTAVTQMTAVAQMAGLVQCLQERWQQVLGVLVAAIVVAVTMMVVSWAVKTALEPRLKNVSIRGLWVTAAFLFVALYLVGLVVGALAGAGPFEQVLFHFFHMDQALPTVVVCLPKDSERLWSLAAPFYFPVLYALVHVLFVIFAFVLLIGLVGLKAAFASPRPAAKKGDDEKDENEGGTKGLSESGDQDLSGSDEVQSGASGPEDHGRGGAPPEGLLAPLLGPLFQWFGYWMDLTLIERRYKDALGGLIFALWLAKWLTLPAAFFGTLSPLAWIVFALLVNALSDNLKTLTTVPERATKQAAKAQDEEAEQRSVSIAALMKAIDQAHDGFELHSVGAGEAGPARLVESRLLSSGPAMRIVAERLGLASGLYAHQEACFTHLSEGSNVLLATAPLSGRTTVGDLLVIHQVLSLGKTVLYLCPSASSARDRREALDNVVRRADWDWNLFIFDLCNEPAEALDLNMRQPQVLLLTPDLLHEKILPQARDWELFLRSLGLVVALGVETYTGAPGANFYRLMRRFQKVCADYGAEPLYFATAVPYSADLRAFAEALLGVSLVYVGPGMDTAPEPAREIVTCLPGAKTLSDQDIPIPVLVAGTAAGLGHRAALVGFEGSLTLEEEARLAEVLIQHGKTGAVGRSGGAVGGAGSSVPGRLAEVVVTEADAAGVRLVTELTRHFGADLVDHSVRLDKMAGAASTIDSSDGGRKGFADLDESFGLGESAFGDGRKEDASKKDLRKESGAAEDEVAAAGRESSGEDAVSDSTDGASDEQPYWSQTTSATVVLPSDQPFVKLLMAKGLVASDKTHPHLGRGCDLVTNPDNESAREKNLLCALAESSWAEEALFAEFGTDLTQRVLADLEERGLAAREDLIEIEPRTGMVRQVPHIHYVGHPLPHGMVAMDTVTSDHVTVTDRHTKTPLIRLDRVRALTEVYPGLVFMANRQRYRICDPDDQTGFDDGIIYADPYERPVITSKIRRLVVEPAQDERRKAERRARDRRQGHGRALESATKADRRGQDGDRRTEERRATQAHSFGGSAFFLWYPWVHLHEWVEGVKTYDRSGRMLDVTYFSRPIETRYRTRAAVLAFPTQEPSAAVLHSLVHLFGHVLPSFVHHGPFDLDIAFAESYGKDELPAIFFLDRHPGDAGFARSVTTEVLKHLCYWAYQLAADCPNHCESPTGCLGCLRSLQCHLPHGGPETDLDRQGTLDLIEQLLGGFPH